MENRAGNWIEIRWNGWFFLNVCKNNLTRIGLMNTCYYSKYTERVI